MMFSVYLAVSDGERFQNLEQSSMQTACRVRVGVITLIGNRQIIVELSYINITGIGIEW